MSTLQEANIFDFAAYVPAMGSSGESTYREVYEHNRHRIYALAFWLTGNELEAEELMANAFCQAFANCETPAPEVIDCALITEARHHMPVGLLTLNCTPCDTVLSVRHNMLRVDLERAVMQLPTTERMIFLMHDAEGYDHARIARTLGLTEDESRCGLHQARLGLRELLGQIAFLAG